MRLVIFGATGGTGLQLVRQACEAGHDVTAVVRDPARLPQELPNLRVVRADVMDAGAITPAVEGQDAVLSAMGPRDGRRPTTVCTDSATAIIAAMRATGVGRLIVLSNSAMHIDDQDSAMFRWVVKPIIGRVFRHAYVDQRRMEEVVTASGLEWTIVRPPQLTDDPRSGRYRTAVGQNLRGGAQVSRADLADAVLRFIGDEETYRAPVSVAR